MMIAMVDLISKSWNSMIDSKRNLMLRFEMNAMNYLVFPSMKNLGVAAVSKNDLVVTLCPCPCLFSYLIF